MATKKRCTPVVREVPIPSGFRPLAAFRHLQARFPDRGACYFQRAVETAEGFRPVQTTIGLDPFETVRMRAGRATIDGAEGTHEQQGSPFAIASDRIERIALDRGSGAASFQGGAFGYFGYDCVRHLEKCLQAAPGNLGRVDSLTSGNDAELILVRKVVVVDHLRGTLSAACCVVGDEAPSPAALLEAARDADGLLGSCLASLTDAAEAPSAPVLPLPLAGLQATLGREVFLQHVRRLKEHIRAGDIFQAVLSDRFSTDFPGDPLVLFELLCRLSPSPYQFYFSSGRGGGDRVYLGASPEMLLKVSQGQLETHPIAGTRPRGSSAAEERKLERQLLRSTKERAEHLMLVDLARNDVGRVAVAGTVTVPSFMELKKFGGVMHLTSTVKGTLRAEVAPLEALAACFPAGTLSGAPKIRAMELLSGLEPLPRGFYGGAVISADFAGNLDSCIAIRSAQIEGGQAVFQAGAGIVADSRPEAEYAEVEHKTRMIRTALAGAAMLQPQQGKEAGG